MQFAHNGYYKGSNPFGLMIYTALIKSLYFVFLISNKDEIIL